MQVSSIWSEVIEEPPSCVAICAKQPEVVVIGTYLLHKTEGSAFEPTGTALSADGTQKRTGRLVLYLIAKDKLERQQVIQTSSAVLDAEWSPREPDLLAVATSVGTIDFYELKAHELTLSSVLKVSDPTTLVLDLIWHPTQANLLAVTLSDGDVLICRQAEDAATWTTETTTSHSITQHDLEPWTLAFSADGKRLLSGGDDMVLQCCNIEAIDAPMQLWSDRRAHQAGVTAILPTDEELLVTGSYDDHVRLLHVPAIGRRSVLAELNLGGGVWRLKLLDRQDFALTILASCMHAGTRIVRLRKTAGGEEWQFEVLAKFEKHESMNYGTDVQPGPPGSPKTIVSTSFYDRRVCLWQFDSAAGTD